MDLQQDDSDDNAPWYNSRGDARMNQAVKYRLENPDLSVFQCLCLGGFNYLSDDADRVDEENVTLAQRKNQLSRRMRKIRERVLSERNEETTIPRKKKAKRLTESRSLHESPSQDSAEDFVGNIDAKMAAARTDNPLSEEERSLKMPAVAQSMGDNPAFSGRSTNYIHSAAVQNACFRPGGLSSERPFPAASSSSRQLSHNNNLVPNTAGHYHFSPIGTSGQPLPFTPATATQGVHHHHHQQQQQQLFPTFPSVAGNNSSTSGFAQGINNIGIDTMLPHGQGNNARAPNIPLGIATANALAPSNNDRESHALALFAQGLHSYRQQCMIAAGYSVAETNPSSNAYKRIAFLSWQNECEILQRTLGNFDPHAPQQRHPHS